MRIYYDCLEMIKEVKRDLAEMGINYQSYSVQDRIVKNDPDYITKELIGYCYTLFPKKDHFKNLEEMLKYEKDRKYILWVHEELNERLGPSYSKNPGSAWQIRKEFWEQYLRREKFSYTYAERWREQIDYVIHELRNNPSSRQVIMTMYDKNKDMMNWGGLDRVPCSLTYHFLIRNKELNLIYSQRSCDFINFFQSDVYCTIGLQKFIAYQTGAELGKFVHIVNSLHAFRKDVKDVF